MARWDQENTGNTTIPDWFWQAVETPAESRTVEVDECDVAYRFYPSPGKRGMLLIHGMNAHSRWWDFIAPQLLDEYQIAAMDLTGMGDSDYRYNTPPTPTLKKSKLCWIMLVLTTTVLWWRTVLAAIWR